MVDVGKQDEAAWGCRGDPPGGVGQQTGEGGRRGEKMQGREEWSVGRRHARVMTKGEMAVISLHLKRYRVAGYVVIEQQLE